MTEIQRQHSMNLKSVQEQMKNFFARGQKVKIYHGSTNSTRAQKFEKDKFVDVSQLDHVIEINTSEQYILVEPNVPMDKLVEATLKHRLIPPVVMEFPGITVGGGIQGGAGESSSFRYGLFHDTCLEYENDLSEPTSQGKDVKVIENAPVAKIVATILRYAIDGRASDIHIEPTDTNVKIRFRVDGVMNTSLVLPARIHSAVIAKIKLMSNMRLDEKRKPQDGRFSAKLNDRKIDFRVSTFPTYFGEKIVIRILDQEKGIKKLSELGISKNNLSKIMKAIEEPYGLVLISGPTGSGKSTTLYSMLNEVDKDTKNVLSLEDPIEYNMEGMSQSQVRPEIGYTFASGLRTTLRQDPDIIMVGEYDWRSIAGSVNMDNERLDKNAGDAQKMDPKVV
jgi:type II secretory ATPase GspE/PulE/Tfp pilus assembly ATPase PilB-like protein